MRFTFIGFLIVLGFFSSCSFQKRMYNEMLIGLSDTLSGVKVILDPENEQTRIMRLKNGKKNGVFAIYGKNGYILYIGRYKKDKKVGTWILFYDNGQPSMIKKYRKGNLVAVRHSFPSD